METVHYAVALAAGFAAGIINTLAGSGSIFTLPALLFLGLPPHIANGTNRVGILLQTLVGAVTLYRKGGFRFGRDIYYVLPVMAGSGLGAFIATGVDENALRTTIAVVMLLLLLILLFNYTGIIRKSDPNPSIKHQAVAFPLLFVVGFYGGFIQLGVGIFLLSVLLLLLKYTPSHGNAIKNSLNFFLTVPAFLVFAGKGHIQWETGLVVAAGQVTGAYLAARFATSYPQAPLWIRGLLIVMTAVTSLKLFGII
jgi:hypothetical protein